MFHQISLYWYPWMQNLMQILNMYIAQHKKFFLMSNGLLKCSQQFPYVSILLIILVKKQINVNCMIYWCSLGLYLTHIKLGEHTITWLKFSLKSRIETNDKNWKEWGLNSRSLGLKPYQLSYSRRYCR